MIRKMADKKKLNIHCLYSIIGIIMIYFQDRCITLCTFILAGNQRKLWNFALKNRIEQKSNKMDRCLMFPWW